MIEIILAGCFLIAWLHARKVTKQKQLAAQIITQLCDITSDLLKRMDEPQIPHSVHARLQQLATAVKYINQ